MMLPSSRDRLTLRDGLRDTRLVSRLTHVLIPTVTECPQTGCGYDQTRDSGLDPSCETCDGLGQIATFKVSSIYANIRVVEQALLTFGQAPPGAQVGDTFLTIDRRDWAALDLCSQNKDAYLSIDGGHFRPHSVENAGVGQIEEHVVMLRSYKPKFTKAGY